MKKLFLMILSTMFLLGMALPAQATLIGDTVELARYYSGAVKNVDTVTVTAGDADAWSIYSRYTVNVEDTSIAVDFGYDRGVGGVPFTGLQVSGIDDAFTDVSIDTNIAGWADSRLNILSDGLQFDWSGLSYNASTYFVATLDFGTTQIPDLGSDISEQPSMHNPVPAPILLLGTGLMGLAGFRRKTKK